MSTEHRQSDTLRLRTALIEAGALATSEWGFAPCSLESAIADLPTELQSAMGRGLRAGSLTIDGTRFALPGLGPKKGPYTLFTKDTVAMRPLLNLEYYVQVAEYLRLDRLLAPAGFQIGFEDNLMDVTVRRDGRLLWYIEAKDVAAKAIELLAAMARYANGVPIEMYDRGNDGLRKAKYLVGHRPPYFTASAVGFRKDFLVEYLAPDAFSLRSRPQPPSEAELLAVALGTGL
jgi:hypothetical protein